MRLSYINKYFEEIGLGIVITEGSRIIADESEKVPEYCLLIYFETEDEKHGTAMEISEKEARKFLRNGFAKIDDKSLKKLLLKHFPEHCRLLLEKIERTEKENE